MRKLGFICLALLLAAGALGVVYSSWSQNLNTNAAVSIAQAPAVSASGANAGTTSATLNGSLTQVAPGNAPVSAGFQYWDAATPGIVTTVANVASVSSLNDTFSAPITGLTAGHTYGYQSTGVGLFTVNSAPSTFTVNSTLTITTGSLPNGIVGVPYSQTLQASGGSGTYTSWTISNGSLPAGLSLHSGNIISGTPTAAGFPFTIQVTDNAGVTASATLSITIVPAASQLVFSQQPTDTAAGIYISPAVTVKVEDTNNNVVNTSSAPITIAIATNPAGGLLSGMLTVNAINGIATFSTLSINNTGTGYSLSVSSTGLTGATSNSFNVIPGSSYLLSLETQPDGTGTVVPAQSLVAGSGTVTVYAIERNASGQFVANVAGTWSLANIAGGIVNSELVPNGDSKSAVFTAGTSAGSAIIHVIWGSISAYSGTITVTPGNAILVFTTEPNTPSAGGVAFATQPIVTLEDSHGNPLTNYTGTVSLAITSGTGQNGATLSATSITVALSNGVAAFSGVSVNWAGTNYTLTATMGSFTATSTPFSINAVTRTYTGIGANDNFSQADHWIGGSVPGPGDNIIILNTCNFDNAANNFVYGTLTLGNGSTIGTLQWPAGGTNTFQVTIINAVFIGSKIDMTNGGTLKLSGSWTTTNMTFTAGTGTVNYNSTAAQTVANLNYNNLTFSGVHTNNITINGAVGVAGTLTGSATFSSGNFVLTGSTFTFNGTGAQTVISLNNVIYPTLTINKASGTATLGSAVAATAFNMTAGIFDPGIYALTATTPTFTAGTLRVGTVTWAGNYSFAVAEPALGTIEYYAAGAQTVNNVNTYGGNLTLSGSGTKTLGAATTTIGGNLTLSGSATATTVVGLGVSGALSVGDGATFTAAGFALTVTGTTTVGAGTSGTLIVSAAAGIKIFTGLVTVNAGGTWNNSGNSPITFRGGITTSPTFTAGSGVQTFDTNSQALIGTFTIPSVTVTGITLTNNNTLTVATALIGTGGLTQTATGTLNIGGTSGITTLTATNTGNTVNYNGTGAQTVKNVNYYNLAFSGARAATNITINGIVGVAGTLNSSASFSTGNFVLAGSTFNFNGLGIQTVLNLNSVHYINLTLSGSGAKTTAGVAVDGIFTMGGDATVTVSDTPGYGLAATLQYSKTAPFTAGAEWPTTFNSTGGVIIGGTGAITTNAAMTLGTNVPLTINIGGTLTASGAAAISIAGNFMNSGTFNAGTSTINFNGTAQTIGGSSTTAFYNLTTSGSGIKTTGAALTIGGNLSIGTGTTFATGATNTWTLGVTGTTSVSGTLTLANTGAKTFTGDVTVNSGSVWNETGVAAVNFAGNFTNNATTFTASTGVHTFSGSGKTISGSTTISISNVAITGIVTNSGILAVTAALTGAGSLTNGDGTTGTLNIGGTSTITTLFATAIGNTVNYTGAAQTVNATTTYVNLGLSGSGAKTLQAGTTTISGTLTLSGTVTTATVAGLTVGALNIGNGTTFTAAGFALTVGTTTVGAGTSGTLTISAAAGAKLFTGLVTIIAGGTWNNSGNSAITFRGGITNSGTFTAGTGVYTFDTNSQVLNGTFAIPSVTVTGVTLTNNNSLTVATALAGSGGLTQAASATLNIGGTSGITTLTATASGNTVNYTGAAQTVNATTTYVNLGLSGTGVKTTTGVIVNGIFTDGGNATVTVSAVPSYGSAATLQYSKTAAFTAGIEWPTPFNGTGGVIIGGTGTITTNAAKSLGTNVPLTINVGATLATGITNTWTLTVGSTTSVSGTLTIANTGTQTFTGAVTINNGGKVTETSAAALSFGSDVNINGIFTEFGATTITITGDLTGTGGLTNVANATLNISGACSITTLTNAGNMTITGSGTISTILANLTNTGILNLNGTGTIAGITNSTGGIVNLNSSDTITSFDNATPTSTLNISDNSVPTITTLIAMTAGNTVNYTGTFAQTVKAVPYSNLILSGSGAKTIPNGTIIHNDLSIAPTGNAAASIADGANISVSYLTLGGNLQNFGASTWGGIGSGATHINNTYFAASTGILTVAN